MSVSIVNSCVSCWACLDVCPSQAIYESKTQMQVDKTKCSECNGFYADIQCASVCPVEGAILDSQGLAFNPPGSLTGIYPEKLAQVPLEF
ncbi:4Fe-4S binding protein [Agaribacterium haliotis]|uniref:4Fe-4S binding protein n=1 Tax=Agaribacterium haliotis TaxID=2013869 RepID=UPI000BB59632|nr:4Fe-4S dicluster domain-containing protein [Agaribacterium haliotis]